MRTVLEAAGWSESRDVDATGWIEALQADGYAVLPAAERVLSRFGGLSFLPPFSSTARSGPGRLSFIPLAETAGERARIGVRERQLDRRLCPVGEWCDGEYMLLIADDGHIFAETNYQVLDLGPSIESALHRIIVRDEPISDMTRDLTLA